MAAETADFAHAKALASAAMARCVAEVMRSARLVVEAEQLIGWRGMPTTPPSSVQPDPPHGAGVLRHRMVDRVKIPIYAAVRLHDSETLRPQAI